jgi:hypothetical protein
MSVDYKLFLFYNGKLVNVNNVFSNPLPASLYLVPSKAQNKPLPKLVSLISFTIFYFNNVLIYILYFYN